MELLTDIFLNKNTKKPVFKDGNFKLPIEYHKCNSLDSSTIDDLELEKKYCNYFNINNNNKIQKLNLDKLVKYFSTNKYYLKDTQKLLKYKIPELNLDNVDISGVLNLCEDIKNETGFCEKYDFVEYEPLRYMNNNGTFLQALSIYNLSTPVISLALPILLLIIPFFIIKLQGYPITLVKYYEVLRMVLSKHSIGKLFDFNNASGSSKIYIIVSIIFYFVQVYYNFLQCFKFIKNMNLIHERIFVLKNYLFASNKRFKDFSKITKKLKRYDNFTNDIIENTSKLTILYNELDKISKYSLSFKKIGEIGHVMKCYYDIYNNSDTINLINYSMYLNSYISNIEHLSKLKLAQCKFTKKHSTFKNVVDISIPNSVSNNISLDKNIIITGPNASGKTTILKTLLINILFSQQYGCGFYKECNLNIYNTLNCYINIPDTSSRDSLFQAEARRCKTIINIIKSDEKNRHFCIFDELFSGTNPVEAIASGTAFLEYLNNKRNVNFIITTHFINICEILDNICKNTHMDSTVDNSLNNVFTYKIKTGISTVKGGINVLKKLNFPNKILNKAYQYLN